VVRDRQTIALGEQCELQVRLDGVSVIAGGQLEVNAVARQLG
jgi:hypothetical protein